MLYRALLASASLAIAGAGCTSNQPVAGDGSHWRAHWGRFSCFSYSWLYTAKYEEYEKRPQKDAWRPPMATKIRK